MSRKWAIINLMEGGYDLTKIKESDLPRLPRPSELKAKTKKKAKKRAVKKKRARPFKLHDRVLWKVSKRGLKNWKATIVHIYDGGMFGLNLDDRPFSTVKASKFELTHLGD
jgi:hypothetical protein